MSGSVTIKELDGPSSLRVWAERLRALAISSGALFFQSPEWIMSWAAVLEPTSRLVLFVDGPEDRPEGAMVLATMRRRVQHTMPVGFTYLGLAGSGLGAADHLGPLTTSETSARRLFDVAAAYADHRPVVLSNLAPQHRAAAAGVVGAVEVSTKLCPSLDLTGVTSTHDVWNPKFEKNVRRRTRLMAEAGLSQRWVHDGPEAIEALGALRRLHLERWTSQGGAGLFDRQRMDLLVDLVARNRGDDGVWIQLIEREGNAVAALLGFQFGRTFCSYKTGWSPAARHLGPGILLHGGAIERAISLGMLRYDFLRGAERHKFALGGVARLNSTFVVPNGVPGRLLIARDRLSEHRSVRARLQ